MRQKQKLFTFDSGAPGGGPVDQRARSLRKNATMAERILWASLRQLKPAGLHFRRQAPFRHYILDFACHSAKLVVEVDGSQHADPEDMHHDAIRTAFLNSQGYRVLRFWNVDVITNSRGISDAICVIAKTRLALCDNCHADDLARPHKREMKMVFAS
jgi:very-short-patch-repair endonuclease